MGSNTCFQTVTTGRPTTLGMQRIYFFILPLQCVRTSAHYCQRLLCRGKEAKKINGGKITQASVSLKGCWIHCWLIKIQTVGLLKYRLSAPSLPNPFWEQAFSWSFLANSCPEFENLRHKNNDILWSTYCYCSPLHFPHKAFLPRFCLPPPQQSTIFTPN